MNSDFPYLGSLEVEGVKCFKTKQILELSTDKKPSKWNIILGNNGTGKTTLLKSIVFCSPADSSYALEKVKEKTLYIPWLHFAPELLKANINNLGGLVLKVWNNDDIGFIKFEGSSEMLAAENPNLDTLRIIAFGASRKMSNSALSNTTNDDDRHSSLLFDSELLNGEEWLLQADYALKNNAPDSKARLEKIKKLLVDILPDVQDFEFETSKVFKNSVIAVTDHGRVPMRDLSHGYLTMMAWVLDFARRMFERFPESENPLAEPAICLVDEIDLHLHPSWQRRIIQDLDRHFPNTQFIVTSHSPLIVQAAPADANIVLLKKEEDGVKIYNHMDTIKNWRVDQILTSDLFGLETARPPQTEDAIRKRAEILSQKTLTKEDEALVASLEKQIGDLPVGETSDDIKAMEIIRNAARKLQGI